MQIDASIRRSLLELSQRVERRSFKGSFRLKSLLTYIAEHAFVPQGEVVRRLEGGILVALRPSEDAWERQIFARSTYEPATLATIRSLLRPGDTMLDVGANLGLMTMTGAQAVGSNGKVIAFEPLPSTFNRLQANVARNGLSNVTLINCALADQQGTLAIYRPKHLGTESLVPSGERLCSVAVDRMDALVSGPVHLIKIDVEGFEASVIKGGQRVIVTQRPYIILECNRTRDDADFEPYRLLMATGFYECLRFSGSIHQSVTDLVPVTAEQALPQDGNIVFRPRP